MKSISRDPLPTPSGHNLCMTEWCLMNGECVVTQIHLSPQLVVALVALPMAGPQDTILSGNNTAGHDIVGTQNNGDITHNHYNQDFLQGLGIFILALLFASQRTWMPSGESSTSQLAVPSVTSTGMKHDCIQYSIQYSERVDDTIEYLKYYSMLLRTLNIYNSKLTKSSI